MTEKNKRPVKEAVEKVGKTVAAAKNKKQKNTVKSNRLKLLVTTVNRNKGEYYADLLQSFDVNLQTTVLAEGTASKSTLSLLGLTNSSRTVIFSVIQEDKLPNALEALEKSFATVKDGKGMAFTVPFSSMIGALAFGFLSNNRKAVKDGDDSPADKAAKSKKEND